MQKPLLPAIALILALSGPVAQAQNAPQAQAFSSQAMAVDPVTLAGANNMTIVLWGITPAEKPDTPEGIRARVFLDDLIAGRQVRCLPMVGMPAPNATLHARCLTGDEKDISLQMLNAGLATVNRGDVTNTELAQAYLAAERRARLGRIGVWESSDQTPAAAGAGGTLAAPGMIAGIPLWLIVAGMLGIPLIGFLSLGTIMYRGLRQLITLQRYQLAGTQKRERQLKEREKYVIASALDGELMTNRAKLDAFLVIYEELLKSLRDPAKTPKYQRAGDILHEKPALMRTVYDAHVDKLDLLGPSLASDLTTLYNMIVPNPDYKMLEPEVPLAKAQEMVDKIVRGAEKLMEPMDKVAGALAVIVRDKRGAITVSE